MQSVFRDDYGLEAVRLEALYNEVPDGDGSSRRRCR
jgi:hypothetical protein